jgi:lysophospholipase
MFFLKLKESAVKVLFESILLGLVAPLSLISVQIIYPQRVAYADPAQDNGVLFNLPPIDPSFLQKMETKVEPFYASGIALAVQVTPTIELPVSYFPHPNPKGVVLYMTGAPDSDERNKETLYDFFALGYSVFGYNHRGMGYATRLGATPQVIHVDEFEDYVSDLHKLITTIIQPSSKGLPLFISTVSMGGAVVSRYVEKHPGVVSAAVLGSPMYGIFAPGWFLPKAYAKVSFDCFIGKCRQYAPGQNDHVPEVWGENTGTSDYSRWRYTQDFIESQPQFYHGGKSNGFAREVFEITQHLKRTKLTENFPFLIFQAEKDNTVTPTAQVAFCSRHPACKLEVIPGARHDIMFEKTEHRNKIISAADELFTKFTANKKAFSK